VPLLAAAGYLVHTRTPHVQAAARLGEVRIYPAWLRTHSFIYLFSGARGWSAAEEEAARDFARGGSLVIGIDTPQLLQWMDHAETGCIYLPGQLEDYSRALQRANDSAQYLAPVLLGHDVGATLVYMAQLQAPPLAFSAAVAIDPQGQLPLQRAFCDHPAPAAPAAPAAPGTPSVPGTASAPAAPGTPSVPGTPSAPAAATGGVGQIIAPAAPGANVPSRVLLDGDASAAERQFVTAIPGAAATAAAGSAAVPAAVPSAVPSAAPIVAGATLHGAYEAALASIAAERSASGVADLPLAEVPSAQPRGDAFAILYSGDGGWRDLDRSLADVLAAKGMSVVGVDVLRYYWTAKTPAVAASDLARIIGYYQQRWQRHHVVLIGFSFGADVLPFLVSRLPPALAADVSLLSLLSPERTTAFEVEATGWLGVHNSAGMPIAPELKKLAALHVQCIYGTEEGADSLCTTSAAAGTAVLAKSGGHHFDHNYDELADEILAAVPP
jgi:type IV secretory pathway VirJ component